MTSKARKVDWTSLREKVTSRDLRFTFYAQRTVPLVRTWREWKEFGNPCLAPALDPLALVCHGRITLDHIKFALMMGRKAPDDEYHLVSLCWHHHLDGWATAHRPLLRDYLIRVYGRDTYAEELPTEAP